MDIQQFVKEALLQVVQGIRDAQSEMHVHGGVVNPSIYGGLTGAKEDSYVGALEGTRPIMLMSFDIAVTASENTAGNVGAKLTVASVFSAGAGGTLANASATTSRIAFKVPVVFPADATTELSAQQALRKSRAMFVGGGE
jgi:hypothetical protein